VRRDRGRPLGVVRRGETWAEAAATPLNKVIAAIAVDPRDPEVLLAGSLTDGVLISGDGGATFSPSGTGSGRHPVRSLAIDPTQPTGSTRPHAGLFWSTDFGHLDAGGRRLNPRRSQALAADPARPGVVFAGDCCPACTSPATPPDLEALTAGLVHKSVNSLAISVDGNHLYAGSTVTRVPARPQPPSAAA